MYKSLSFSFDYFRLTISIAREGLLVWVPKVKLNGFDDVALLAWFLKDACASYFIYACMKFSLSI